MLIKIGVDLLPIHKIQNNLDNLEFMKKTFHDFEKHTIDANRLASIYALKECVFKALDITNRNWLDIEVSFSAKGKPRIKVSDSILPTSLLSLDCSISGENGFVLANVVLLIE